MAKEYINSVDEYGYTALMNACRNEGFIETVKLLLDQGADVNFARKDDDYTALMLACCNGLIDIAKLLINHGADISLTNEYGGTALLIACCNRYPDIVKLLLDNGADANSADIYGVTPLMAACNFTGDIETVRLLLDRGAHINLVDEKYNSTVLMMAYNRGFMHIVQLLLEKNPENTMNFIDLKKLEKICAQSSNDRLIQMLDHSDNEKRDLEILF